MNLSKLVEKATMRGIRDFTFFDELIEAIENDESPSHGVTKESVEYVRGLFKDRFFSPDLITDMFYKNDSSKSVTIVMSQPFLCLSNTKETKLTKQFSTKFKYKSEYLSKNHFNFFSLDSEGNTYALSREGFKKVYATAIYNAVMECSALEIKRLSHRGPSTVGTAMDYIYSKWTEKSNISFNSRESLAFVAMPFVRVLSRFHDYGEEKKSGNYDDLFITTQKSLIVDAAAQLTMSLVRTNKKDHISFSRLINSTFDYQKNVSKLLFNNTKIEKVESINPISGFISIKNTRVRKDDSELSEEKISMIVNDNRDHDKLMEDVENSLQILRIDSEKKNKETISLVEGDMVVALYNHSSYAKLLDASSSAPLHGSCMKGDESIPRIRFYAENPDLVKLLALTSSNGKILHARALVWCDKESGLMYVDRIFYTNNESRLRLIKYALENPNMRFIYSAENIPETKSVFVEHFKIKVSNINNESLIRTPYFDSLNNNVYGINGSYYIGRFNGMNEDVESRIPIHEFNGTNGKLSSKITYCDICRKKGSQLVKINNRDGSSITTCRSHIAKADDGLFYLRREDVNSSWIYVYKKENTSQKTNYCLRKINAIEDLFEKRLKYKDMTLEVINEDDCEYFDLSVSEIFGSQNIRPSEILHRMNSSQVSLYSSIYKNGRNATGNVEFNYARQESSLLVAKKGLFKRVNFCDDIAVPSNVDVNKLMIVPRNEFIVNNLEYFTNLMETVTGEMHFEGIEVPKEMVCKEIENNKQSTRDIKLKEIVRIECSAYTKIIDGKPKLMVEAAAIISRHGRLLIEKVEIPYDSSFSKKQTREMAEEYVQKIIDTKEEDND